MILQQIKAFELSIVQLKWIAYQDNIMAKLQQTTVHCCLQIVTMISE